MLRHRIGFCTARDGVRLAHSVSGKGDALLVVKSFWGHLEDDLANPVWRHWIEALTRHHRVVRYDCRGTGLSDRRVADYSFDTLVADAQAVVDSLGLKRFAVVSLTGGAPIAIALAARRPAMVSHLAVHGGNVRGRFHWSKSASIVGESLIELVRIGWDEPRSVARQMLISSFIPDAPASVQEAFDRGARASAFADDAARIARANYEMDVRAEAPSVRCPVINLQPVHNNLMVPAPGGSPLDEGRLLASLISQARLVPLDSRNHIILEHEPAWQHWCAEVHTFLCGPAADQTRFSSLSPREMELAGLLIGGLDNAQIAAHLAISEKTVRNHVTRIFAKLQVATRAQAIVLGRDAGVSRFSPGREAR